MQNWFVRLLAWKHAIKGSLESRWYCWPIVFALDLAWHAIQADTNEYLAKHGMERMRTMLAYVPSSSIALAVWLAVLVFVGLSIHAYFDTRGKNESSPSVPIDPAKEYWNPPSYFGVEHLGRKIESAIYVGLAGKADVKTKIEGLSEGQHLPVNHYELCGGVDPSWGDKFLTITYSETLRQGDVLSSPVAWLRGTSNINTENAPRLLIDYSTDGLKNFLTLKNDHVSETLYRWNLRPIRCTFTKTFSSAYGAPAIQGKHEIVQEFLFEEGLPLVNYLRQNTPPKSEVTAEMYFENDKGAAFVQAFDLVTYPDGSLKWQPGLVRPQS